MEEKQRILIVDDEESVLRFLRHLLEMNGYTCTTAGNAAEARQCMEGELFELVLCDVTMPGESGIGLAQHIVTEHPDTAVVMVTAVDDPEIGRKAMEIGAYGYIIKPFGTNELIIEVANALRRMALEIQNRRHRDDLERLVQERTEKLQETLNSLKKTLEGTVQAMALTVESRDPYTSGHQRRVAHLATAIASELNINRDKAEGLRMAGVIHDLGKISVPSEILSKPGRINDYEFGLIKGHPQVGYDILKEINFPWPIAKIVLQHHEKMDGSGYPLGLKGEDILMEARILCVADVVEAMASHRPYRPTLGIDKALEEILSNRGVLYDPEVVDACLRLFKEKGYQLNS